jgi:rhamnosyltransferase
MPIKNGGSRLERVLTAVYAQRTGFLFEVVAIDSGSTDNSLEILRRFPVRLVQIAPEEFSHSKTRNLGAARAAARMYYIFLNQDAVPSDEFWLENLVYSIRFESDLKAVCATELNEHSLVFNVSGVAAFLFKSSLVKGLYVMEPYLERTWSGLPKYMIRQMFPFTTVCAIFDKEHFDANPFDESTTWGEDLHWAVHNSRAGYKAGCSSFARVYHYHDYTSAELADITKKSNVLFRELFDLEFNDEVALLMSNVGDAGSPGSLDFMMRLQRTFVWKMISPLLPICKRFSRRK